MALQDLEYACQFHFDVYTVVCNISFQLKYLRLFTDHLDEEYLTDFNL